MNGSAMATLPIIDTATEALRDITTGVVPLWRAAERPLLIGAIASFIAIALWSEPASAWLASMLKQQMETLFQGEVPPEIRSLFTDPEWIRRSGWGLITAVTGYLTSVLFCPAWYRHLLALPAIGTVPVAYVGWRVLYVIGMYMLLPLVPAIMVIALGDLGPLLTVILLPVLMALMVRGCMVFPAICAGRPLSLQQSLRLTAGTGFSLLVLQLVLTVAAAAASFVIMMMVQLISLMLLWDVSVMVLTVVGSLFSIVITDALAVAGFAAAYRRLIRTAPPGLFADREA